MECKDCRYYYMGGCWNDNDPEACPLGKLSSGKCLVCGERVKATIQDGKEKICDNCKRAILVMRKIIEEQEGK